MGILYYSYNVFTYKIIGTCFEQCLDTYIETFHKAIKVNRNQTIFAMKKFYPLISSGYRSITELNFINTAEFDESRIDLFARYYIKNIGDIIECALKPHVMFLDNIFSIVSQRKTISKNLGEAIYYLSERKNTLINCYKTIFYNIQISQWRNVADHNDYKVLNDNEVEIEYGSTKRIKKTISRDDLVDMGKKLDTLIYSHKIAFTLISYDNYSELGPELNVDFSFMQPQTLQDIIAHRS
ncbi:MAG: hypothetical protein EOM54_09870 [Clostridia bacterium]|nr:hypothetical protein [Clostridia bacterium]